VSVDLAQVVKVPALTLWRQSVPRAGRALPRLTPPPHGSPRTGSRRASRSSPLWWCPGLSTGPRTALPPLPAGV